MDATMECEKCPQTSGTPSKDPNTKRNANAAKTSVGQPDGASAWCVAFAAFLINFIMAGLSRMSGILYVAFIEMFHTDRKGASMPFSVRSSVMNLLGPVVGILGQKFSVRIVSIIGGVLSTVSAAACFLADDIGWITVIWGGINGAGTALVTTLTTVVISQYFDEYRTTASGMSFSGACIGSFIFPPLMEELLHYYGLGGSFLIIAGITMHTIPAAMILRKPLWIKLANRRAKRDVECAKGSRIEKSTTDFAINEMPSGVDINYLRNNSKMVVKLLTTKSSTDDKPQLVPPEEEILREMEDVYSFVGKTPVSLRLSEVPGYACLKLETETSPVRGGQDWRRTRSCRSSTEMENVLLQQMSPIQPTSEKSKTKVPQSKSYILQKLNELYLRNEKQIFSSFSEKGLNAKVLKELKKLHKVYEAIKRRNIFLNAKQDWKDKKITPKTLIPNSDANEESEYNSLWENIKNSISLHKNPLFLLISICRAVHFTTFIPVITIIVDYAMDKGMTEEDGVYVIAALSIGDLIGRLCLGWVTDRGFISLPKYMLVAMVLQGISTASIPMMYTKLTLLPTIIVYAALQGSVFVRHTVLISNYMKSNEQSIAMGCVSFLAGIFGFAVPTYVGFFRDTIGSYDGIFYLNGAIGAATGLIWIFESKFLHTTSGEPVAHEPKV